MLSIETRPDRGYVRLRATGDDVEGDSERYVHLHRLAAFAWGELEDLGDERTHVHHRLPGVPWLNTEANLVALDEREHGELERRRQIARGSDGPLPRDVLADHGPPFGVPEERRVDDPPGGEPA